MTQRWPNVFVFLPGNFLHERSLSPSPLFTVNLHLRIDDKQTSWVFSIIILMKLGIDTASSGLYLEVPYSNWDGAGRGVTAFCNGTVLLSDFWAYPSSRTMNLFHSLRQISLLCFSRRGGAEQWHEKTPWVARKTKPGQRLPFLTRAFPEAPPASLRGSAVLCGGAAAERPGTAWNRLEPSRTGWNRQGAALSCLTAAPLPPPQRSRALLPAGTACRWNLLVSHTEITVLFCFVF